MKITKGTLRTVQYRTVNRLKDTAAVAFGWCNHSPRAAMIRAYADEDRHGGGYSHWRCYRPRRPWWRRHDGPHRFNNYTWDDRGATEYAPVREPASLHGAMLRYARPDGSMWVGPRWLRDRHLVLRRADERRWQQIVEASRGKRR